MHALSTKSTTIFRDDFTLDYQGVPEHDFQNIPHSNTINTEDDSNGEPVCGYRGCISVEGILYGYITQPVSEIDEILLVK